MAVRPNLHATRAVRSSIRLRFLPLAIVGVIACGCGSHGRSASGSSLAPTTSSATTSTWTHAISLPNDACDLLKKEEVQNLVGYPVTGNPESLDSAQGGCTYAPVGSDASSLASHVVVRIIDSTRTKANEATLMKDARLPFAGTSADVPALGPGAFCDARGGSRSPILVFAKANLVIELNAPSCAVDQRVATIVSSRLAAT
jgi:hypothetical protein